jgi:hypothetical protein
MWVHTRPRNEHENAILINLDMASRINISKLGERWFIEVMIGTEAFPIAIAESLEEAGDLMRKVFDALKSDEKALDLEEGREEQEPKPAEVHTPEHSPEY